MNDPRCDRGGETFLLFFCPVLRAPPHWPLPRWPFPQLTGHVCVPEYRLTGATNWWRYVPLPAPTGKGFGPETGKGGLL